jgi:membrane peptidoglycan carboxypeptidase
MVGSSTEVTTAVWVGNIKGEFSLGRFPNGGVLRHQVFRTVMAAANETYGGEAFPPAPDSLRSGGGTPVPDLTGRTIAEAESILAGLGLRLGIAPNELGEIPQNAVIGGMQTAPGVPMGRGQAVYVTILVMPDLVGRGKTTLAQATETLAESGFSGTIRSSCDARRSEGDDLANGVVSGQVPDAGTLVAVGQEVNLSFACPALPEPDTEPDSDG